MKYRFRNRLFLIIFSLFFLGNGNFVKAQNVLKAKIKDAKTDSSIPFVNIGVLRTGRGTVSDKGGFFKLKVDSTSDTLMVSAIGYNTRRLKIEEVASTSEIQLEPKVYEMKGIEVTAKMRRGKDKIFGSKIKNIGGGVGFGDGQKGDEIGALIKIRRPVYLKSAHFIINKIRGDSMLYRVNIYDYSDQQLGENLLKQNILIQDKQRTGTISVDLSKLNLVVKDDVLLALELIKVDTQEYGMAFRYWDYAGKSGNFRIRFTTNSKNVGGQFERYLPVDLGFYFIGNKLR